MEAHKTDSLCEDGNCVLDWLDGRNFSISAKLSMAGWTLLLSRLVTGSHWPQGWTYADVRTYLEMLDRLAKFLRKSDSKKLGENSVLKNILDEYSSISGNYQSKSL